MTICDGCGCAMLGPFMVDAGDKSLCADCTGNVCFLCGHLTDPGDRLPWLADDGRKVVEFECVGAAMQLNDWPKTSLTFRRQGRKFRGVA